MVEAWSRVRDADRFAGLPANPGWIAMSAGRAGVHAGPAHLGLGQRGARPRPVEVRSVEPVGTGQIGACYRVRLSDGDGRLVAAGQAARRPTRPPATMLAGAYRGEVTFYADLAATVAVRGAALRLRRDRGRLGGVHAAARGPRAGRAGRPDRRLHGRPGPGRGGQPRRAARPTLVRPDPDRGRHGLEPQRTRGRRDAGRALRADDRDCSSRVSATCSRPRTRRPCARASA